MLVLLFYLYIYEEALKLNCDYIATGHYASIRDGKLVKSKEEHKDQTYFLYGIKKELLDKIIFPLADFSSKEEIRKIAEENDLIVARKKDSQEICFIPNDDYKSYLKNNNVSIKELINEEYQKKIDNNILISNIFNDFKEFFDFSIEKIYEKVSKCEKLLLTDSVYKNLTIKSHSS